VAPPQVASELISCRVRAQRCANMHVCSLPDSTAATEPLRPHCVEYGSASTSGCDRCKPPPPPPTPHTCAPSAMA
jgi:hypothetical protein